MTFFNTISMTNVMTFAIMVVWAITCLICLAIWDYFINYGRDAAEKQWEDDKENL